MLHRSIGSAARLVTLVGAGGTGKTRLALELAAETLSLEADSPFRDGVIWVDLAAITDPTRVWQAVSHAVGLGAGAANLDPAEALVRALCDRRLLLVVDNCEELVARCRELAEVLLAGCPDLVILATSRTPLHSSYEQVVSVPPMSAEAAFGERSEAAELFYDRAARVLPAYPSQADDLDSVNALCRLVDGLPLALELAAPWIRTLSARDLLAEIDHSMDLLSSADSALTGRHRSMGAVLETTWRWLSLEERRALRALGVFVGGISAEAAAAVAGASPALLAALGERSLIHRLPDTERGPRYSMHELVRQHALEMLQAEGPAAVNTVRARHLDFFLQLYERARADIDGPDEVRWTGQVRRELANASAARAWAVTSGRPESALRLTAALAPVWGGLSGTVSYQDEFQEALALPWDAASDVAAAARATVLNAAGFAAMSAGDLPAARRHFEDASSLYQHLGDQVLYARALNNVGWAVSRGPDPESGLGYLRQGLAICQRAADPLGIAWSHYDLGEVLFLVGQDAEAERLVLGGLRQMTELGVPFGIVASQITLGHAYRRQGRWGQAIEAYAGALRAHLGSPGAHGSDVLAGLGVVALALERPGQRRLAVRGRPGVGRCARHQLLAEPEPGSRRTPSSRGEEAE